MGSDFDSPSGLAQSSGSAIGVGWKVRILARWSPMGSDFDSPSGLAHSSGSAIGVGWKGSDPGSVVANGL